jgi:hypothetical protein
MVVQHQQTKVPVVLMEQTQYLEQKQQQVVVDRAVIMLHLDH